MSIIEQRCGPAFEAAEHALNLVTLFLVFFIVEVLNLFRLFLGGRQGVIPFQAVILLTKMSGKG